MLLLYGASKNGRGILSLLISIPGLLGPLVLSLLLIFSFQLPMFSDSLPNSSAMALGIDSVSLSTRNPVAIRRRTMADSRFDVCGRPFGRGIVQAAA